LYPALDDHQEKPPWTTINKPLPCLLIGVERTEINLSEDFADAS
jgi:hypothetical protein